MAKRCLSRHRNTRPCPCLLDELQRPIREFPERTDVSKIIRPKFKETEIWGNGQLDVSSLDNGSGLTWKKPNVEKARRGKGPIRKRPDVEKA
jgi:hypothetical protein